MAEPEPDDARGRRHADRQPTLVPPASGSRGPGRPEEHHAALAAARRIGREVYVV